MNRQSNGSVTKWRPHRPIQLSTVVLAMSRWATNLSPRWQSQNWSASLNVKVIAIFSHPVQAWQQFQLIVVAVVQYECVTSARQCIDGEVLPDFRFYFSIQPLNYSHNYCFPLRPLQRWQTRCYCCWSRSNEWENKTENWNKWRKKICSQNDTIQ